MFSYTTNLTDWMLTYKPQLDSKFPNILYMSFFPIPYEK